TAVHVDVGGAVELEFALQVAGPGETVNVAGEAPLVETQSSEVASVVDERAISQLPLNGRRFSDLALLTPGVTQDPRSLTSSANGDLAFGGVRGFHSSFLVDGADNNNAFFAQARGRYRAPYQFSNEVIQEFRVSSNTYGAELGRSGGAVINVVTKSGSNHTHGSVFYYLRDSSFSAQHPFVDFKPADRQQQFGLTLGGRLRRNRVFYYAGFDQHVFRVPTVVEFDDGSTVLTPTPADYEVTDQAQVFAAAAQLSTLGGEFRSALLGNSGLGKLDVSISPRHYLTVRVTTSRYYGQNNVFFDPTSPVTHFAVSENGEEQVSTVSAVGSLTSSLSARLMSHLRVQFSRDLQESSANSPEVRTRVDDVIEAFGRSSILPRRTREHRLHLAETLSLEAKRHSFKFGGDFLLTWIDNYFPSLFGGQYIFDNIRVNPFTFQPQTFGLAITPLRAYAHTVPRFYIQNFGSAVSRPDTREYALFAQDSIRVTNHFALTLGVRWDLQTFRSDRLVTNPAWPESGKVPHDANNIAPRVGFAYSMGERRPLVVRGGYGIFYTRIPQIYNSAVERDNGLAQSHLFLDNADFFDQLVLPTYPNPLVSCPPGATTCTAPLSVAGKLTTEISAFSARFQTPFVQQASLSVEKEMAERLALGISYLYVHGEHLIRARDVNLPPPIILSYPVYDESGTTFTGNFFDVGSFSTWQLVPSLTCPFPPCINPVARPIASVGEINEFESAASSVYHALTVSVRRRMTQGVYFRAAYTWAQAIDDTQDALVAGRPATVENSFSTRAERGRSVTDQRHRLVFSGIWEPKPFHADHPNLKKVFNGWRFSGVFTAGSGRPVNARIVGDANQDGNTSNDRLPGFRRNFFTGPNYITTDLRVARRFELGDRFKLEVLVESFNLMNRQNLRVDLSDDGFLNSAGDFVRIDKTIGFSHFPAHYRLSSGFLQPTNAYAPRQVQIGLRLMF
ncbi:MAG: TonB-dependent receptor plug domain-containing protein, partial [Terriglobales bacterium]